MTTLVSRNSAVTRKTWLLTLLPGIAFMLVFIVRTSFTFNGQRLWPLFDDSMVSMTYARTFAVTGELRWTPDSEKVQGFTNLAWTLFMSLIHKLQVDSTIIPIVVSGTSALLIIGISLVIGQLLYEKEVSISNIFIAMGLVFFSLPTCFLVTPRNGSWSY